jgi:hypothetical protein
MVRLRREIEGIRVDLSIPMPAYATDNTASTMVLPGFDRLLGAIDGARVLVAGAPRAQLAMALAEAGRQVTITDLGADRVRQLHKRLSPPVSSRVNLVEKPYAETSFSASSFDVAIYSDLLHRYPQAQWLIHKLQRELKVDGVLYARLFVRGDMARLPDFDQRVTAQVPTPSQQTAALAGHGLAIAIEATATGRLAGLMLSAKGRDAVERGAHLPSVSFAGDALEQLDAVASRLRIEALHVGHGIRCRLANLLFGAHTPVRRAITRCAEGLPDTADAEDLSRPSARVVGVVARKALADLGKRRRLR